MTDYMNIFVWFIPYMGPQCSVVTEFRKETETGKLSCGLRTSSWNVLLYHVRNQKCFLRVCSKRPNWRKWCEKSEVIERTECNVIELKTLPLKITPCYLLQQCYSCSNFIIYPYRHLAYNSFMNLSLSAKLCFMWSPLCDVILTFEQRILISSSLIHVIVYSCKALNNRDVCLWNDFSICGIIHAI